MRSGQSHHGRGGDGGGQFALAAYLRLGSGEVAALRDCGCHETDFVTPEYVVSQVLGALPPTMARGLRLPIACNTSSRDSLDSPRLIDGIVDFAAWWPAGGGRLRCFRAVRFTAAGRVAAR